MDVLQVANGARLLRQGAVIAYPTEACYGLGCLPENLRAVKRILRIKNRPSGMGMILIADNVEALLPYLQIDNESLLDLPLASWPGPYTWIFPVNHRAKHLLPVANDSIAVRVTDHPGAAQLCWLTQRAIVSTSANRHGFAPLRTHRDVHRSLGRDLDFIVRGAIGQQKNPTQIRDAISGQLIRAA